MLFVALCKVRSATERERAGRRLQWQYPEGLRVLGEYWLQTPDPNVIIIAEADDIAPLMASIGAWDDVFDISIVPAIAAEDGMELARRMMPG
jgi:hypothetical protein